MEVSQQRLGMIKYEKGINPSVRYRHRHQWTMIDSEWDFLQIVVITRICFACLLDNYLSWCLLNTKVSE